MFRNYTHNLISVWIGEEVCTGHCLSFSSLFKFKQDLRFLSPSSYRLKMDKVYIRVAQNAPFSVKHSMTEGKKKA